VIQLENIFRKINKYWVILGLLANSLVLCSIIFPWGWRSTLQSTYSGVPDAYKIYLEIGDLRSFYPIVILYLPIICITVGLFSVILIQIQTQSTKRLTYNLMYYVALILFLITGMVLLYSLIEVNKFLWAASSRYPTFQKDRYFTFGIHLGFILCAIGAILNISASVLAMTKRRVIDNLQGLLGLVSGVAILLSLSMPWFTEYISPLNVILISQSVFRQYASGVILFPIYIIVICSIFIIIGSILELIKTGSVEVYINRGGIGVVSMTVLFIIFWGMAIPLGEGCWVALVFGIMAMASARFYKERFYFEEKVNENYS